MEKSTLNSETFGLVSMLYFDNMGLIKRDKESTLKCVNIICNSLNKLLIIQSSIPFVGIFMKQSIFILLVIIGCLKLKRSFVCLDVECSSKSNIKTISTLQVSAVLIKSGDSQRLKTIFKSCKLFDEFNVWNVTFQLWVTGTGDEITCSGNPPMMYAVQTSGSTGEAKIVQVPEQSILPNIKQLSEEFHMTADDVVLVISPPTFDPFMVELLLGLYVGATLLVISPELRASPQLLLDTLFPADSPPLVTIAQFTPSVFTRWSTEQIHNQILTEQTSLRVLALGGEIFPSEEFWKSCQAPGNKTQLYNLYGTSEVSCWAMMSHGPCGTLGSAMAETLLKVVSDSGDQVDNGSGELFIGSESRICVVGDELWAKLEPPVYRPTGDIVTVRSGEYQYVGRRDNMVKRWGHRVSLDQVELVAMQCSGVTAAGSVILADTLALFVCLGDDGMTVERLRSQLAQNLGKAAMPDVILVEPHVPLNRHGKINRNKLKQKLRELKEGELNIDNPIETFQELWKKYSDNEGESDLGFVSGGGNSVAAMQVMNRMRVKGMDLPMGVMVAMLNDKTLKECCDLMVRGGNSEVLEPPPKRARSDQLEVSKVLRTYMKGSVTSVSGTDISDLMELRISWAHDMAKCVDGSPTCFTLSSGQCIAVCGSHSGQVVAVCVTSGQVVWLTRLPDRVESSLAVCPNTNTGLIGCYDGRVHCLSLTSGTSLWTYQTGAMVKGVPLLVNGTWVFGSYDYHVYCITVDTGEPVWKRRLEGIVAAAPVLTSQPVLVVVTSLSGQVVALCPATGQPHWQTSLDSPVFSTPCVTTTLVLVAEVAGTIHALSSTTGQQCWTMRLGGEIFSSLVADELDNVVLGCHDGHVYRVRSTDGQVVWCQQLGSPVYATPTILPPHHLVAATTAGIVTLLRLSSGQVITSTTLPGQVFSSPVFVHDNRTIIVGSRDNHLYCLNLNK